MNTNYHYQQDVALPELISYNIFLDYICIILNIGIKIYSLRYMKGEKCRNPFNIFFNVKYITNGFYCSYSGKIICFCRNFKMNKIKESSYETG